MGAPAFSSPPADQQQQQQEAHAALHAWQRQQQQRQPWKASLGPAWDAKLPHDQRYGEKGWRALETYDRWLRGQPVMACVFGKDFSEPYAFEEACYVESPYDITGMCDACTLNSVLGRALYSPAYHGDCFRPRFDDELDRFVFDIDTRRGVESEFAAFARCGHEVPPCTDELKDLMLQAAQRDHEFQRWCDMGQPRSEHHWQSDWLNDKLEAQRAGRDPPQQETVDADDDDGGGGCAGYDGGGGGYDDDFPFLPDQKSSESIAENASDSESELD